ncbi:MAG: tetratricopeptide repeat protein, partial [Myxococcales bacterium]|nr:tetratricopeptide repeat protein [Myxococcales bacterium]
EALGILPPTQEPRATEAMAIIKRLRTERPDDLQVRRLEALAARRTGDVEAELAAKAALAAKSEGSAGQRELGDALARNGRTGEAAAAFAEAAKARPDDPDLQLRLGTALGLAGRWDEAEAALGRSVALAPSSGAAWRALAQVRENRGDASGAAAAYESLLKNAEAPDADALRARITALREGGLRGAGGKAAVGGTE